MLVLQAKEERTVPCWLLPECGILGSWAAGWWHLMVPRPSPRDGRARVRGRSSSHSPGLSNSTLSPGTPSLSTRANHSNLSLITEILTVVIGEIGTSMTRLEDSSITQCAQRKHAVMEGSSLCHHQPVQLAWELILWQTSALHDFQKARHFVYGLNVTCDTLKNLTDCYELWEVWADRILPSWHKAVAAAQLTTLSLWAEQRPSLWRLRDESARCQWAQVHQNSHYPNPPARPILLSCWVGLG